MKHLIVSILFGLFPTLTFAYVLPVEHNEVTLKLENVTFSDGGSANGRLCVDTLLHTIVSWHIDAVFPETSVVTAKNAGNGMITFDTVDIPLGGYYLGDLDYLNPRAIALQVITQDSTELFTHLVVDDLTSPVVGEFYPLRQDYSGFGVWDDSSSSWLMQGTNSGGLRITNIIHRVPETATGALLGFGIVMLLVRLRTAHARPKA